MLNKVEGDKLKNFKKRLKRWKPVHLCWLFEKLHLPIPKYLIGAASGTVILAGSRIANATRTWQADEDLDVADWTKTNDFIFAIALETEAGKKASKTVSIRWRNKTDGGNFVALSDSGELTWTGTTDLVNDNALIEGEAGCTPSGAQTWMDGVEREGANDVVFDTNTVDYWSEYHWAIDCSGAHDGDEYEFEIYSVSNGIPVSTCASTITMVAGAPIIDLAGSATCSSTVPNSPIQRERGVSGTGASTSSVPNSPVKRTRGIIGSVIQCAATVVATLVLTTLLTASVTCQSSVSGDLSVTASPVSLTGTATATSSAGASMTVIGWLSGFNSRYPVDVEDTYIDDDLLWFPLLVKFSGKDFAEALSNGYDIRFTKSDGTTLLSYEREYWNKTGDNADCVFWVSKSDWTLLASGGETIYMYFGKADAPDGENAANVWDDNYKGVWHLKEASGNRGDSSGNNNILTDVNTVGQGTGRVWKCADFEEDNDESLYITDVAQVGLDITGDITIEFLLKLESLPSGGTPNSMYVLFKGDGWGQTENAYAITINDGDDKITCFYSGDGAFPVIYATSNSALTTATWYHCMFVKNGSIGTLYVDSIAQTITQTGEGASIHDSDKELCIGDLLHDTTKSLDGLLDEVRISSIARPVAWIKFEHANINEGDNELTWGNKQSAVEAAVELTGDASVQSSASATLERTRELQASAVCQSSVSAKLTKIEELQGTASCQSSVSAELGKIKELQSSTTCQSTAVASLTVTEGGVEQALSGSSTAQSVVLGILKVTREIETSSDAQSSASAELSVTGVKALSGSASCVSNASSIFERKRGIQSSATLTGSVSAELGKVEKLTGSSAGLSSTAGLIKRTRGLNASADAQATVVADLIRDRGLTAPVEAQLSLTAGLRATWSLSGLIEATSSLVGELGVGVIYTMAVAEGIGMREVKLRSKREYSEGEDIITRILSSIWRDIDKKETTWETTKKVQKDE